MSPSQGPNGLVGLVGQPLVDANDFVSTVLDAVGAIVIVVDAEGGLARYNTATCQISGYSRAEIDVHGSLDFLVPPEQRMEMLTVMGRLEPGGTVIRRDNEWVCKDGSRRHIAWANSAVMDQGGLLRFTIATGIDITERKNLEEELAHQTLHDSLTGLPNRRLLMDRLEHALESRRGGRTCVMFADVDDFKLVNDSLGHDVGDIVLKTVAERLAAALRPGDTVARLSGDEFAVVLEEPTDGNTPDLIAVRLLEAVARPIEIGDRRLTLTMSIGSAVVESTTASASDLLRNADFAMYAAKEAGGARYRRYKSEDRAALDDVVRLEADLAGAVGRHELRVHYQPIVDLRSGEISGVEALVRWQHPQRGLLAPSQFIPIAERTGSIIEIGRWVFDTACLALHAWQLVRPGLSMSVNLSGRQLESPMLVEHIRDGIRRNGIDPATLILEVTESVLLGDLSAVGKLDRLKALGLRLAIDDFGTGYSSISYIRRFPVDLLKIDREFTDGVNSPEGLSLLRGIAQLGHLVGLVLVAEGIERMEQIGPILDAGCYSAQGYLFARPMDAQAFAAMLHAESPESAARRVRVALTSASI